MGVVVRGALVAVLAVGLVAAPASAHPTPTDDNVTPGGCEPRSPADTDPAVVLFGDSQSQDVYAFKGRSQDYALSGTQARRPPPDARYLADWYRARGWDVCEAAADGQAPMVHGPGGQPVDLGSGRPMDDVLGELGADKCAAVQVARAQLVTPTPPCPFSWDDQTHFDLMEVVAGFRPDEVVLNGGATTAAVLFVDRWFRWWQEEGGTPACPVRPAVTASADPKADMLACPPAVPARHQGLDFADAVGAEVVAAIQGFADRLFAEGVTDVHWLLRFRTKHPLDQAWQIERQLVSQAAATHDGVAGRLHAVDQGLDDGTFTRVDPQSGQGNHVADPGPVTNPNPFAADWHGHLTAFGAWRAARTVAASICPSCAPIPEIDHAWPDGPAWLADALVWLDAYDLMDGYRDGRFHAGRAITRGQFVRLLHRLVGAPDRPAGHGLVDVPAWLEDAVRWAADDPAGPAAPVMTGYPSGHFRPSRLVSRGEVLAAVHRLATPDPAGLRPWPPWVDVPPWLFAAASWAGEAWLLPEGEHRLLSGVGDHLQPDRPVTRGEVARFTFRALGALIPANLVPPDGLAPSLLKDFLRRTRWAWGPDASAHWDATTTPSEGVEQFPWTYRY